MNLRLIPFLGIVLITASCVSPERATTSLSPRAKQKILKLADRWQVPQPPADAMLTKVWEHGSDEAPFYVLGFVSLADTNKAFVGASLKVIDPWTEVLPVPDPDNLSLADITPASPFFPAIPYNVGLLSGVQLVRRGHEGTGWALFEKGLQEEAGHSHSPLFSPTNEPVPLMLARTCLAVAVNDILSPMPDFKDIKGRVEVLLKDQRKLRGDATNYLLEGLEASVHHQLGQAGSMESLVDQYVLAGDHRTREGFTPAARALILAGFEAVPALLKQRHATRFSNHLMQGFNNFPSYPMNAGQVINQYLQLLANDELGSNWLRLQQGYVAEDDAVLAWWRHASELGEKEYARRYTVKADPDRSARISDELLEIVKMRYPELLVELYRNALNLKVDSWDLADAVVEETAISREQKITLLLAAIATNLEENRNAALGYLRRFDPMLADRELVRLLKNAPSTPAGKYWTDQDAQLSGEVCETENAEAWQALRDLLARADVGMSLELIKRLRLPADAPPVVVRAVHEMFHRYKDDGRIRDEATSEKFFGPGAGFPYDVLTVSDFVHLHWARMLSVRYEAPPRKANSEDWRAFREKVKPLIEQKIDEQLGNL